MLSTLFIKGAKDLRSGKTRTILTILTISLGVAGISLFAINPLVDRTMEDEIERENLNNLVIRIERSEIQASRILDLENIPNVESVEARSLHFTRVQVGERRFDALIVGVRDFTCQMVDRVILDSGSYPREDELLSEQVNSLNGIYHGSDGDEVTVYGYRGEMRNFTISGEARSLAHGRTLYDFEGYGVFYASMGLVEVLSGQKGYNYLSFTLDDVDESSVDDTIGEISKELENEVGIDSFERLPKVRKEGDWPGGEFLGMIVNIMYILTAVAVLASIFLISNTMNTIVSEKRREIAVMKAIGATDNQVILSLMSTSLMIGLSGAIIGSVIGVALSYMVITYFGSLMGFGAENFVHPPTIALSIVSGTTLVAATSLPSLIRASRISVREGLMNSDMISNIGGSLPDRFIRSLRWIPKDIMMGLGNAFRKRRRSLITVVQVCLAGGIFLGLLSFGHSLGVELESTVNHLDYDIQLDSMGNEPIPGNLSGFLTGYESVSDLEPHLEAQVNVNGGVVHALGYPRDTWVKIHEETIISGRWFDPELKEDLSTVVLGKQLASSLDLGVGDEIEIKTTQGTFTSGIIGIDDDFYHMGEVIYLPLTSMQMMTGVGENVSGFNIKVSGNESVVERTSSDMEDGLMDIGYFMNGREMHINREAVVRQNRSIINMITLISSVVVVISFIGLISNITMNIIERTREIGILRCIGSVSIQIRSIFTSESLLLTTTGWAIAVPVGYGLAEMISWCLDIMLEWQIPIEYPIEYVGFSLLLMSVGSVLITQVPVTRATRLRPGDALRYE